MNVNYINKILSEIQECVKKEHPPLKCTKEWMKEICDLEKDLIIVFEKHLQENILDKEIKTNIMLYLLQQHSILSLYANIFSEETKEELILENVRNCCKECFQHCLLKLEDVVKGKPICEDSSGNFMKWMDLCLDKLSLLDVNSEYIEEMFQECYKVLEEVLCHAMSLAQIAIDEDSRIIKGNSKAVLDVLGGLKVEIDNNPRSIPICNLLIDSCSDELCLLERKVNTAVLRLCLKLFSDLTGPLDILERYCLNSHDEMSNDNINLLEENFDLHVDRIIQIGLFAIGCSSYSQYVVKLKANLASLEALEIFLVPSFLLLLKQPSLQNVKCATLLKQYWITNVKSLKQLIYNIIEPSAFCQVVYGELRSYILNLEEVVNEKQCLENISIQPIILQTKVLGEMIKVSLDHVNNKPNLFMKYKRFKAVLHETEAATEQLLGISIESNTIENSKRVLKRCKVLLHLIKEVWYCCLQDEQMETENKTKGMHEYDNCTTGKQLQQKITSSNDLMLTQIINKGKQLLNERSVMYRTPLKKEKSKCLPVCSSKITTKRKTPRSCLPFKSNILSNEESFVNDTFTHLKSKMITYLSS